MGGNTGFFQKLMRSYSELAVIASGMKNYEPQRKIMNHEEHEGHKEKQLNRESAKKTMNHEEHKGHEENRKA